MRLLPILPRLGQCLNTWKARACFFSFLHIYPVEGHGCYLFKILALFGVFSWRFRGHSGLLKLHSFAVGTFKFYTFVEFRCNFLKIESRFSILRSRSCSAHWTLPSTAALQPIKHSNDSLLSPWRLEIYCTGKCTSPSHDELCYLYISLIPDFVGDSFPCIIQTFSGEPVWRWQSDRVYSLYPSSSTWHSLVFFPYIVFFRFP